MMGAAGLEGGGGKPWGMMGLKGVPGLLLVMVLACVPPKVQTQSSPQFNPGSIASIAVVPFQIVETPQWGSKVSGGGIRDPEEIRTQFRLPGTEQGERRDAEKDLYVVPESGARRLTEMVRAALAGRPSLRVVGPPETASILESPPGEGGRDFKRLAREAGTRFGVDGALLGLVRTYREREGSKLGARPAAVGFELYLVRTSDGVVLWSGDYFEEQKPLTEDVVGFFEKGGGFVTVDELAALGVKKVLEAFPVGKSDQTPLSTRTEGKP